MRVLAAGLCALLSSGCADDSGRDGRGALALGSAPDGGADAAADAGQPGTPCDWFVYWLTMVDREKPCAWGMLSRDPATALFRSAGGQCLTSATICGLAACSEISHVRERQVIEVWGPAGLDADEMWFVTDSFDCEDLE